MRARPAVLAAAAAALSSGCNGVSIACTTGALQSCFRATVMFRSMPGDSTRITIRYQNLQGTVSTDNTAWSQLLYIRVHRNHNPPLGFPNGGAVIPLWDASVQTIGPGAPGSGWHNGGANSPSFMSEWVGVGGGYNQNVGYVTGRDKSYSEVANVGSGLRTFTAAETSPGWVTFTFVAGHPVTANDVVVDIVHWVSDQPAATLPVPKEIGCTFIGGGPHACKFFSYTFN